MVVSGEVMATAVDEVSGFVWHASFSISIGRWHASFFWMKEALLN